MADQEMKRRFFESFVFAILSARFGSLGSARGSRAGEAGSASRTFQNRLPLQTHHKTSDMTESSFRWADETSRLAACAPLRTQDARAIRSG